MASIIASQIGTTTAISYSWNADANSWWSVEVYQNGIYLSDYSDGSDNGQTGGDGSFTPDDYGTFTLKLYTTPGGYVAWTTITTVAPTSTVDCDVYLNGNYDYTDSVNVGNSLPYTQYFYPYNNTVLTSIRYNGNIVMSPGSTFTVPNSAFTLDYYYNNLGYTYTTTESTITISINQSLSYSPTYIWTLGSTTLTGSSVEFTGLTAGQSYTISVSIKLGTKEVGKGSISVTIEENSKVQIYIEHYVNGQLVKEWVKATPWIYVNDTIKWKKAKAWIYNGGWKPC